VVTWISVEQQSLSRASGTKSMGLNSLPGMNSWANLGGPSGTKTGGCFHTVSERPVLRTPFPIDCTRWAGKGCLETSLPAIVSEA